MKKTIYSIVMALILSVILTALTPKWLFKGDARWTYQNNEAAVDVSLSGHVKNGHVKAEGTNMRITQPSYISNKNYQGSVIKFSASYREQPYHVELRTEANEWGEDTSLVLKFKGGALQHKGKRKPAWVRFRNITLNGKTLAENKVVWHDKPFILKFPLHSSKVSLAFSVSKPIAASDFSFKNILSVFLVVSVLTLIFALPDSVTNHFLPFFNRKDIAKVLLNAYQQIDPVYRRSFWIVFGMLCLAFGFHTICYMWGNHDWHLLEHCQRWLSHQIDGRYMVNSIKVLLLKGLYQPFVHDFIIFITLAVNAVLLCRYWHLEKRIIYFVLCGLVLTVQPFTLCMIWYVNMTPEVFIGVTCALLALLLSEKVATGGGGGMQLETLFVPCYLLS